MWFDVSDHSALPREAGDGENAQPGLHFQWNVCGMSVQEEKERGNQEEDEGWRQRGAAALLVADQGRREGLRSLPSSPPRASQRKAELRFTQRHQRDKRKRMF